MKYMRFDGEVFDQAKQDMGVHEEQPINLFIDVDRIVCIRDHYDDDGYNGCIIYLDSGHDFWTPMETEEVLRKIGHINEGITIK